MEAAANIDLRLYQLSEHLNTTLNIETSQWEEQNISLWENLMQQYLKNRGVSDNAMATIVAVYLVLIVAGSLGNGLVCLVVARKPKMRTARNVFIINLACSDLLLCLFTMPFTLIEVVLKVWSVGELMCKLVTTLQATSIYVSTMSITAIALDRYNVIVFPTREWSKRLGALVILAFIWLVAFLLASPLFVFRQFARHKINMTNIPLYVNYCYEDWPIDHGRAVYSVAAMLFQYVLPITIVSVAHHQISMQLHTRLQSRQKLKGTSSANTTGLSNATNSTDGCRLKKTNLLLGSIALIFAISWMPLHILNLVTDFYYSFEDNSQTFKIVFASCHVFGMSSACSNPFLYGWLNDNFRKEFKEVFAEISRCLGMLVPGRATKKQTTTPVPLVTFQKNNSSSCSGALVIASPDNNSGVNNCDSVDPNGHYDSTGHLRWSISATGSLQSFGEESSAITRITSTYVEPMDERDNSNEPSQ